MEKSNKLLATIDVEGQITLEHLKNMPIVVSVEMDRTNRLLDSNAKLIGRTEGVDLWHFS